MKKKIKVAVIVGTRPDIIKMAPVIIKLKESPFVELFVITTAQHREMFDQISEAFSIPVDFDLNIMKKNQGLPEVSGKLIIRLSDCLKKLRPGIVLVQGDTTTAFIGSLAAFYNKICIGHIEAGLRTYDKYQPYPEEINRKLISSLADLHFAPTCEAKDNLLREGVNNKGIYVTGNTVIDALSIIASRIKRKNDYFDDVLRVTKSKKNKIILVTAHRRENWGQPIRNICQALKEIASIHRDVLIIYPVHLNPNIKKPVFEMLGNAPRIFLFPPLGYEQFVSCLNKSYLVLTDSGGIQEEAPSLGKPVFVLRKITERPEAVKSGSVKMIGVDTANIVLEVSKLLSNEKLYKRMSCASNPYGDGRAAERIVKILLYYFKLRGTVPFEFKPECKKSGI